MSYNKIYDDNEDGEIPEELDTSLTNNIKAWNIRCNNLNCESINNKQLITTSKVAFFNGTVQNFNAVIGLVNFNPVPVFDTIGIVWNAGLQHFSLPLNEMFIVEYVVNLVPSSSTVEFELQFDFQTKCEFRCYSTSNCGKASMVISTIPGDFQVRVQISRIGADATAKNTYSAISSYIRFIKIGNVPF